MVTPLILDLPDGGICQVPQELQMNTLDKPGKQGNIFVRATSTIKSNPLN
jgi:hypothetical protein